MPLTKEDVEYGFRMILGRAPESEAAVQFHMEKFPDIQALRNHLLNSKGFRDQFWRGMAQKRADASASELDFATRKLVFLHIPKNAGTTLTRILDKNFKVPEIFPHISLIGHYPASFIAKHRLFHGHYTLNEIQYIPGEKYVFTLLREPRARILSQYHYHKSLKIDPSNDKLPIVSKARLPLKEYLSDPEVRQHISLDNMQTRYLMYISPAISHRFDIRATGAEDVFSSLPRRTAIEIAKENLESLANVGLVEEFDKFLKLLLSDLDIPVPDSYERQNVTTTLARVSPKSHAKVNIEQPDEAAHALMDDLVSLDEELYRYGASLFNKRFQRFTAPQQAAE